MLLFFYTLASSFYYIKGFIKFLQSCWIPHFNLQWIKNMHWIKFTAPVLVSGCSSAFMTASSLGSIPFVLSALINLQILKASHRFLVLLPGRLRRLLLLATTARGGILPSQRLYAVLAAHVLVRCTVAVVVRCGILWQLLELVRLQQPVAVVCLQHSTLVVVVLLQRTQRATVVLWVELY